MCNYISLTRKLRYKKVSFEKRKNYAILLMHSFFTFGRLSRSHNSNDAFVPFSYAHFTSRFCNDVECRIQREDKH